MKDVSVFLEVFGPYPISIRLWDFWCSQNPALLEGVAEKIRDRGANPWVFLGDERHFEQFAERKDWEAVHTMTPEERAILSLPEVEVL